MQLTANLINAASWDAGNASMKAAGRTKWNDDDYNAAAALQHKLDPCPTSVKCWFCNGEGRRDAITR